NFENTIIDPESKIKLLNAYNGIAESVEWINTVIKADFSLIVKSNILPVENFSNDIIEGICHLSHKLFDNLFESIVVYGKKYKECEEKIKSMSENMDNMEKRYKFLRVQNNIYCPETLKIFHAG